MHTGTERIIKNTTSICSLIFIITFLGCGGGGGGGGAPGEPAFFGVGEYHPGGAGANAAYVDASGLTVLSADVSHANAILTYNGDIFAAGRHEQGADFMACYWKNGTCIPLITSPAPDATALYYYRNNIYIAGQHAYPVVGPVEKYIAAYWIDDGNPATPFTHVTLENPDDTTLNTYATGIYVVNSNVFVSGMYFDDPVHAACYWNNSSFIDLTPDPALNSYSTGISVAESTVYISGKYETAGGNWVVCYWEDDGVAGPIMHYIVESLSSDPTLCNVSLTVKSGFVYACGHYFNGTNLVPFYWRTGDAGVTPLEIPVGAIGTAGRIFIAGNNDIHVLGGFNDGTTVLCRWLNGVREDLTTIEPPDTFTSYGFAIYIP